MLPWLLNLDMGGSPSGTARLPDKAVQFLIPETGRSMTIDDGNRAIKVTETSSHQLTK